MQRSLQLTTEQRKLIENNYFEVKDSIRKSLSRYKSLRNLGKRKGDFVNSALSYLSDATLKYNQEKAKDTTYLNYVTHICIFKALDEFRSLNRHTRKNVAKRTLIDKIKTEIGSDNQEDVNECLLKRGLDPNKFIDIDPPTQTYITNELNNLFISDEDYFKNLEWKDFINSMVIRADDYFEELNTYGSEARDVSAKIRKKLIKEYIIPIASGKPDKTLGQIAKEIRLTEGRLSQMLHDDSMKTFIKPFKDAILNQNKR